MKAVRGFTLIEMLVVLAILGTLAAAAHPLLELQVQRRKESELREALRNIRSAIDAYRAAVLQGQLAVLPGGRGYPPDLRALVDGVPDLRAADGGKLYFLRRIPRDPFADPRLPAEQTWVLRSSDSPPDNPRAGADVMDVISTSRGVALDGSLHAHW